MKKPKREKTLCAIVRFIPPMHWGSGGMSDYFHAEIRFGTYRPDDFENAWDTRREGGIDSIVCSIQGDKEKLQRVRANHGNDVDHYERCCAGFFVSPHFELDAKCSGGALSADRAMQAGQFLKRWEMNFREFNRQFGTPWGVAETLHRLCYVSPAARVVFDAIPTSECGRFHREETDSASLLSRIERGISHFGKTLARDVFRFEERTG